MPLKIPFFQTFLIAVCVISAGGYSAEPAPVPKSLEEQVTYLEGALSESLRLRDFAMLEMAVKGFKAANLPPKDLELSILRAERDAAWTSAQNFGMQGTPAASMEAWGLMARAKLGDENAHSSLRKMAADVGPIPEPLPAIGTIPAADYQKLRKIHDAYSVTVAKRGHALLALALLKEPGIQEAALAAVEGKHMDPDRQVRGMGNFGANPAILAVLQSGEQSGWAKLLAFCADEQNAVAVKEQVELLAELTVLITNKNSMGPDEKFSITHQIRQQLPKDAQLQLVPAYASLLRRYTPDLKQGWDNTLNSISNIGMTLPPNSLPPDGVAAAEALLNKLPGSRDQYPKQNFVVILKRNGKDVPNTPVKPPKVPQQDNATPVKPPKPPDDTAF